MRPIINSFLPFKGFGAMNLFGVLFFRKSWIDSHNTKAVSALLTHERIHSAQMKELLYIGFYIIYLLEWVYRLMFHTKTAYRGISFEREAYAHEDDPQYPDTRNRFTQWERR